MSLATDRPRRHRGGDAPGKASDRMVRGLSCAADHQKRLSNASDAEKNGALVPGRVGADNIDRSRGNDISSNCLAYTSTAVLPVRLGIMSCQPGCRSDL